MKDSELDTLLLIATAGEEWAGARASIEIADRLANGKRLTPHCVTALVGRLLVEIEAERTAAFLSPNAKNRTLAEGRKAIESPLLQLFVVDPALDKTRAEGFANNSPERAEMQGKPSVYQETANRLGYTGDEALRAAERWRKRDERARAKRLQEKPA